VSTDVCVRVIDEEVVDDPRVAGDVGDQGRAVRDLVGVGGVGREQQRRWPGRAAPFVSDVSDEVDAGDRTVGSHLDAEPCGGLLVVLAEQVYYLPEPVGDLQFAGGDGAGDSLREPPDVAFVSDSGFEPCRIQAYGVLTLFISLVREPPVPECVEDGLLVVGDRRAESLLGAVDRDGR